MTPARYSKTAIALHWTIAAALAFQISLGWRLEGPVTPLLFTLFQLHKSIGITILVLSVARLVLRLARPRPAPVPGPAWATALAGAVHFGFYVVMIAGPVSGWLLVSTAKIKVPTLIFGTIPWPHMPIPPTMANAVGDAADKAHGLLAWLAIGLFLLHVAGALRHQWQLGGNVIARMIPGARGKAVPAVVGALALILGAMALAKMVGGSAVPAPVPAPAPVSAAPMVEQPGNAIEAAAATPIAENAVDNGMEAEKPAIIPAWTVQSGGRLGFTATWNGEAVRGIFSRWRSAITFNPAALDQSGIKVSVDLASADSGDGQRDESLKGSDFFDAASHPSAIFTSSKIRHLGGDRYEAAGNLTLRGISKPTILRFTLKINGKRATVSGTAQVDRTRFKVGIGEWASTDAIAAGVAVDFNFSAVSE